MLGIIVDIGTEAENFEKIPELTMNVAYNRDGLGFEENIGFVLDDVMKAYDDVFDKLERDRFFLIKAFLKVGDVDLSIGGLEMFDVDGLLFLHD